MWSTIGVIECNLLKKKIKYDNGNSNMRMDFKWHIFIK